jgi:hypothetical protein
VTSTLTGVAATALAIVSFSPAGLGGMVGTSVASGFGADANAAGADGPYANLPAYPAPFTGAELDAVRSQLARTTASLEITRAATDEKIEHIRSIAMSRGAVSFAPMSGVAQVGAGLRLTTSDEVAFTPAPIEVGLTPVSHIRTNAAPVEYVDTHLEFAELLLSR